MAFVSAKCPNCGGDIQLDDTKKNGFCLHCGGKVDVKESIKSVKIDKTDNIEKLLKLAETARASSNNEEAEEYATKVLEIDPTNYNAWFIKGESAGWQSTLANNRVSEMVNAFSEVLSNIDEEDEETRKSYKINMIVSLLDIGKAMIDLACEQLIDIVIRDVDVENLKSQITIILDTIVPSFLLLNHGLNVEELDGFDGSTLTTYASSKILEVVSIGWNKDKNEYNGSKSDMNKYAWQSLIEKNDLYVKAIILAMLICRNEDVLDTVFEKYKEMRRDILTIPCYTFISYDYSSDGYMRYVGSSSSSLVADVEEQINAAENVYNETKQKIQDIKDNEKKAYYRTHLKEHKQDIEERKKIIKEQEEIKKEEEKKLSKENKKLAELNDELKSLGFFKFREKKELKEKIKIQNLDIFDIQSKINGCGALIKEAQDFINRFENLDEEK